MPHLRPLDLPSVSLLFDPSKHQDAFFAAAEIFDEDEVDVAIIGAGPGGTLMAYLLAEQHGKPRSQICLGILVEKMVDDLI